MQLVVSDEDLSCGSSAANNNHDQQQQPRETGNQTATDAVRNNHVEDAILSDDLRDQFETMKRIWRQARRQTDAVQSSFDDDVNETKEKRAMILHDLKRKERETATETAIKVDNEINKWRDGIADLEALLAEENSDLSSMENSEEQGPETNNNGTLGIREISFVADNDNNKRQYMVPPPPAAPLRFPFLPQAILTEDEEVIDDKV